MKNYFYSAAVVLFFSLALNFNPTVASAQCKGFVNEQAATLSPFVFDGKKNLAVLQPGDHSELTLTFYSGNKYRIAIKSTDAPEDIVFSIKDVNNKVLFTNKDNKGASYYDFTSDSTQLLTIEMMMADNDLMAQASIGECVCVLVGCMD